MLVDALLVLLLVGIILYGLGSGVVRQLFALVGVYGGLILASQLYTPLGDVLAENVGREQRTFLLPVAYAIVFVLTAVAVVGVSYFTYPDTRLGKRRGLDRGGGAILAALWGILLVAGLLITLQFLSLVVWPSAEDTRRELQLNLSDSRVAPLMLGVDGPLRPVLAPWVPEALRSRQLNSLRSASVAGLAPAETTRNAHSLPVNP